MHMPISIVFSSLCDVSEFMCFSDFLRCVPPNGDL